MMNEAMRGEDAVWRMRCKVIRNLVRGISLTQIHRILGCARSHVYSAYGTTRAGTNTPASALLLQPPSLAGPHRSNR